MIERRFAFPLVKKKVCPWSSRRNSSPFFLPSWAASSKSGKSASRRSRRISRAGERPAVRLVADANVLLSAVLGGQAKAVLEHPVVESVVTTAATFEEVQEYAGHLAQKKRLHHELVLLAVATLPVAIVPREQYKDALPRARRKIAKRDPDDVEVRALAMRLGWPLWSNDNDLEVAGIEWYTRPSVLCGARPTSCPECVRRSSRARTARKTAGC
jgi:predicted nucleic acid-binding protein